MIRNPINCWSEKMPLNSTIIRYSMIFSVLPAVSVAETYAETWIRIAEAETPALLESCRGNAAVPDDMQDVMLRLPDSGLGTYSDMGTLRDLEIAACLFGGEFSEEYEWGNTHIVKFIQRDGFEVSLTHCELDKPSTAISCQSVSAADEQIVTHFRPGAFDIALRSDDFSFDQGSPDRDDILLAIRRLGEELGYARLYQDDFASPDRISDLEVMSTIASPKRYPEIMSLKYVCEPGSHTDEEFGLVRACVSRVKRMTAAPGLGEAGPLASRDMAISTLSAQDPREQIRLFFEERESKVDTLLVGYEEGEREPAKLYSNRTSSEEAREWIEGFLP